MGGGVGIEGQDEGRILSPTFSTTWTLSIFVQLQVLSIFPCSFNTSHTSTVVLTMCKLL